MRTFRIGEEFLLRLANGLWSWGFLKYLNICIRVNPWIVLFCRVIMREWIRKLITSLILFYSSHKRNWELFIQWNSVNRNFTKSFLSAVEFIGFHIVHSPNTGEVENHNLLLIFREISKQKLANYLFNNLKFIVYFFCDNIKWIIPVSTTRELAKLTKKFLLNLHNRNTEWASP